MTIVFFDLEASALDGWPIEIGWAFTAGTCEGHLIRPVAQLVRNRSWNQASQTIHGITMESVERDGKSCAEIATRMNQAISGRALISDSPEYDGRWLREVFEVAEIDPAFEVSDISADALIAATADKLGVLDLEYTWVERETARLSPRTHRAAADAKYWATFFGMLQLGQEELERRRLAAGGGIALSPTRWKS